MIAASLRGARSDRSSRAVGSGLSATCRMPRTPSSTTNVAAGERLLARHRDAGHAPVVGGERGRRDGGADVAAQVGPEPQVGVLGRPRVGAVGLVVPVAAAGDRGADELRAQHRGRAVGPVAQDVGGPVRVHVAGEHDRVAHPGVDPRPDHAVARGRVAVPGVHRQCCPGSRCCRGGRRTPAGPARPTSASRRRDRPTSHASWALPGSERAGSRRRGQSVVRRRRRPGRRGTGGCRACGSSPAGPTGPAVEREVRPGGHRRAPQRHVLVVGAVGGGAAVQERRAATAAFSAISSAQLFSTSWSSKTTSHGAAACAACRSGSVLYCA